MEFCLACSELSGHGDLLVPEWDSFMSRGELQRQRSDGVADGRSSGSEVGHEWVDAAGTERGPEVLREFDHGEEDEPVADHHAQHHCQVLPLGPPWVDLVQLLHHVAATDGWACGDPVQDEVLERQTQEIVLVHALSDCVKNKS